MLHQAIPYFYEVMMQLTTWTSIEKNAINHYLLPNFFTLFALYWCKNLSVKLVTGIKQRQKSRQYQGFH